MHGSFPPTKRRTGARPPTGRSTSFPRKDRTRFCERWIAPRLKSSCPRRR
jgi:hypothetical protein